MCRAAGVLVGAPPFAEAAALRLGLPGRSAAQIASILYHRNGIAVSERTVRGQLRRAGLHRQKPQQVPPDVFWLVGAAVAAQAGDDEAAAAAQPASDSPTPLAPVLAADLRDIPPDSLTAVHALLVLIWNDELATRSRICDAVLSAARKRGSMSMVAHASCLRSMIRRRLGQLDDAADDAMLALEFKLATSPPLAVAWAASFCIEALTCLGRLEQAETAAARAADRMPPPACWIHTLMFQQARGALRVAQHRHAEALRQVARLAADGLSNRQIAQHLYITQPTVETHLRHAFRKLGITSRADLPAQLASEAPAPAGAGSTV